MSGIIVVWIFIGLLTSTATQLLMPYTEEIYIESTMGLGCLGAVASGAVAFLAGLSGTGTDSAGLALPLAGALVLIGTHRVYTLSQN